ncbi:MAG: thioesterase family protein, partial [Cutibacterium avidum]|nr:thioesterase family protein [Cutibacterium avidum]
MPSTTAELLDLLDLEDLDLDLFRGKQPRTTWQRTFGGQVLAQALVAGARTVPERTAHSMHALFLHAGRTDLPMIFDVERIRDGRTFSTRRVNARQHGRTIFTAELSFKNRENGPEHSDPMPDYL